MTEIGNVTNLRLCGTGSVAPTPVTFPEVTNNDLEQVEGMLVTFPVDLTIDQNYFLGRYGQLTLSSGGRLYNPTNGNGLGESVESNARRLIILDDGKSVQNPNPIPYIGQDSTNRAGDRISGLTGIIDYGPINSSSPAAYDYRIQPTEPVTITRVNARSAVPNLVITPGKSMNLKVASFNVLNYFNGDGQGGGFPTSRGANTLLEFNRQREKIIEALAAINADVVGLMEIENDGAGQYSAIQDLVNGLNIKMGAGTYTFVSEPAPGTDEIKVAMLYKPGRVIPYGSPHNYQVTADPSYNPLFDRPPLAQTFSEVTSGGLFSVVVNHFKSKGSCPTSGPDVDLGQGCWNAKRTAQAAALLDIVAGLKGIDPDVVVVGDLNSYGEEAPIQTLVSGGLMNELASRVAPAERYTYIFDGQSGYLDQGLVTGKMDGQVVGVTIWHINADEPAVIDYNTEFKPQDLYTKTPYRSSDHDPVVLAFSLKPPSAITLETLEATARPGMIRLEWTTGLETGLVGFNLYRSTSPSGPRQQLNSSLLPGGGGDGSYAYEDTTVVPGTRYYYWVEAVDDIDKTSEFGPADALALWGVYLPLVHGQT
jgi:predicted extracellular nuclease